MKKGCLEARKWEESRAVEMRGKPIFAAYFLIPEEKLNKILNEEWIKGSPNTISELAEEF